MAHVWRKFFGFADAHKSPIAMEALELIAVLYAIKTARGMASG
jgi:hypothetical protein